MNSNLFTTSPACLGVRHQLEVLPTFLDQFYSFFELWCSDTPFCTQESIVFLLYAEWGEEREKAKDSLSLVLPCPACQSMGKPNQFRLDRENLGRIAEIPMLVYHIHHYQTFKFAIQKYFFGQCWPNLFWLYSYAGGAELVIWFLCRPASQPGHWKVLVLILLTLRVSIVRPGINIITVISVFSNQYEVLQTNSSFEINNNDRDWGLMSQ